LRRWVRRQGRDDLEEERSGMEAGKRGPGGRKGGPEHGKRMPGGRKEAAWRLGREGQVAGKAARRLAENAWRQKEAAWSLGREVQEAGKGGPEAGRRMPGGRKRRHGG
jgi:hypothetical protein